MAISDGFGFRPPAAADRQTLLALMRDYYNEDGLAFDADTAAAAVEALLSGSAPGRLWLIERQGEVIGYVCLGYGFSLEAGGGDFFLDEIFVVPAARGRGAGSAALDFAERQARALGARRLCLEVQPDNTRARGIYAARGYRLHGRELMSKSLLAPDGC